MAKLGYSLIWEADIEGTYRVEPQNKFYDQIVERMGSVTPYRKGKAFYIQTEEQLTRLAGLTNLKWMNKKVNQTILF